MTTTVEAPAEPILPRLADAVAVLAGWGIRAERFARRKTGTRAGAPGAGVEWRESGAGEPLVLINGIGASGDVWPEDWVLTLERTHRIVRVDTRGTGGSRRAATPFTIADLADDIAAVLASAGMEMAVVLGFSMGGVIAQELALRHPQCVERLVLVSTIPPTPAHVQTIDYGPLLARARRRYRGGGRSWADILARFYLGTCADAFEPNARLIDELAAQLTKQPTPVQSALQHARAIAAWRGPERLAALAVPTTIVSGADDPVVRSANARRLAALIPGARLAELPDVGHMVPWEAGDALTEIVKG